MKWYFIMLIVVMPIVAAFDYAKNGPQKCAAVCKDAGRVMASWGPIAGCTCVEAQPKAP